MDDENKVQQAETLPDETSQAEGEQAGGRKLPPWAASLLEWGKAFVLALILALFLINFVVFFARVPTGSMIPTIKKHDLIVVWRIPRYFDWENRGLSHGDIAVFRFSEQGEKERLLVKRVIGLPGDVIRIEDGVVYRNGEALHEPYVQNPDRRSMAELTVPEGEFFVLGDNRANSYDGRYWAKKTVPLKNVRGEVFRKTPKAP